jgi:dienelactone hydrolase
MQLSLVDTSRPTPESACGPETPERAIDVWLTLPSTDDARPLIVFSHGMAGHPRKFEDLYGAWAAAGYVVAAPVFPLSNDGAQGSFTNTFDVINQPGDVSFVLDELLARAADSESELAGRLDESRIGTAGLSAGGWTTYQVGVNQPIRDTRFSAAIVLDGVPYHESVTYFAVARHPLDVALSDKDHGANMDRERAVELIQAATGEPLVPNTTTKHPDSDDEHTHLRWFIDNDNAPTGSGPNGLADYCDQISVCWNRRHLPNVHLLHYHDMWNDLAGEMRRVADALGVPVDDDRWHEFVEAATLDSMRGRAAEAAPEAHVGMWQNTDAFFHKGGRRKWAEVLSDEELAWFHERLEALAGEAAPWALGGRSALG